MSKKEQKGTKMNTKEQKGTVDWHINGRGDAHEEGEDVLAGVTMAAH